MDFTKDELHELHTRSSALGIALTACDAVGFALALIAICYTGSIVGQLIFAVLAAALVGRLFMLGHDACHQSLTPNRRLNRVLGTVALLPSLHPYSLWDLGHNRIHHRYTNQRDLDYVWEPLEPAEYARLSRLSRWMYRMYRTPAGHLCYYGIEIWWRKMFFPRTSAVGRYSRSYVWDHVVVSLWAVAVPVALVVARQHWWPGAPPSDLAITVACGWILPVVLFTASMSVVIYLHHTHPRIVWTRGETTATDAQLLGAVHVVLPAWVERTLHHIMEHTAHHARPGIPMYRLSDGQALLEERHEAVIVERWSPRFHLDTLRRCKLFDLESREWVGFDEAAG